MWSISPTRHTNCATAPASGSTPPNTACDAAFSAACHGFSENHNPKNGGTISVSSLRLLERQQRSRPLRLVKAHPGHRRPKQKRPLHQIAVARKQGDCLGVAYLRQFRSKPQLAIIASRGIEESLSNPPPYAASIIRSSAGVGGVSRIARSSKSTPCARSHFSRPGGRCRSWRRRRF